MNKNKRIRLLLIFMLIFGASPAWAGGFINSKAIQWIESKGNSKAYNKYSGAKGLYQITAICLKEWNNFHKDEIYHSEDLFNPVINEKIAKWYLEVRIPQMLRYYVYEISVRNILVAYNAGIKYVPLKYLPKETKDYIIKYNKLNGTIR